MREQAGRTRLSLARLLPERTLLIRSDARVSYVSLSPRAQALALGAVAAAGIWTAAATGLLAIETYRREARADAIAELSAAYEARVARLAAAAEAAEAARAAAEAQGAAALAALAERHDALAAAVAAERTLRETLAEREARLAALAAEAETAARAAAEAAAAREAAEQAAARVETDRRELAETLERVALALGAAAAERDDAEAAARQVEGALGALEAGVEEQRAAQSLLLDQIEAAAQLSIGPLEEALGAAGVDVDAVIRALRAEDGQGGPFVPAPEVVAALAPSEEAAVVSVMSDLERVSLLRAAVRRMPFATPVSAPRITSGFGRRRDPFNFRAALHEGIDFAGAHGTPIYSTAHGVVTFAGGQRGYGRVVKIRHDFGFETVYGHLSRTRVTVGDRVGPGDRIGDMGSTGRSTGTHLHYEIRVNGKPVNPMKFIEAARDVL